MLRVDPVYDETSAPADAPPPQPCYEEQVPVRTAPPEDDAGPLHLLKMAVGVAAIALLAAGCSSGSSDDTEALSNSVVIGIGEPEHLLPSNTTEANGSEVLASLFYPLVNFDVKNEPQLVAADSIKPDKNNKVWTITLKPGFTFSNGEPVTSDNYINAWNYGAYGPNAQLASYYFARIDGYAAMQPVDPDGDGPKKAEPPKETAPPTKPTESRPSI